VTARYTQNAAIESRAIGTALLIFRGAGGGAGGGELVALAKERLAYVICAQEAVGSSTSECKRVCSGGALVSILCSYLWNSSSTASRSACTSQHYESSCPCKGAADQLKWSGAQVQQLKFSWGDKCQRTFLASTTYTKSLRQQQAQPHTLLFNYISCRERAAIIEQTKARALIRQKNTPGSGQPL
jgi:hypothetical protein